MCGWLLFFSGASPGGVPRYNDKKEYFHVQARISGKGLYRNAFRMYYSKC